MQPHDTAARWLAELQTHPTRHDLLAAFLLLQKTAPRGLGECEHLFKRPAERAITALPDLPRSPGNGDHLSERPASAPVEALPDLPRDGAHLSERPAHPAIEAPTDLPCDGSHLSERPAHPAIEALPDLPRDGAYLSERPARAPAEALPDPVRFTHTADFAIPVAELLAVTVDPTDPTRHLVTTAGAGVLGPASPLPLALADELGTPAAHAMLDRFHHRRTLLLCRGLLAADLPANLDGEDPWARRICALVGLAGAAIDRPTALRLAPLFAGPDRSPRALAVAVRRTLPELCTPTTTLRCEPLAPRWTRLARDHQTRLGSPTARLGEHAALGERVRLPGTAARLTLGPVPASALPSLRPGGAAHTRLCALLGAFLPDPLALELVVELTDLSLPPAHLGPRALGRDLWLTTTDGTDRPRRLTVPLTPAPE